MGVWVRLLALVALILGQIPALAQTPISADSHCSMPCCAGQHRPAICEASHALASTESLSAHLGCKCELKSAPSFSMALNDKASRAHENGPKPVSTLDFPSLRPTYSSALGAPLGISNPNEPSYSAFPHRAWIGRAPPGR